MIELSRIAALVMAAMQLSGGRAFLSNTNGVNINMRLRPRIQSSFLQKVLSIDEVGRRIRINPLEQSARSQDDTDAPKLLPDFDDVGVALQDTVSSVQVFFNYYARSVSLSFNNDKDSAANAELVQETVTEIIALCDKIDALQSSSSPNTLRAHVYGRYAMLQSLMGLDHDAYVNVASFLYPNRIPRDQLPNVQSVPFVVVDDQYSLTAHANTDSESTITASSILDPDTTASSSPSMTMSAPIIEDGVSLTPDCELEETTYTDTLLDRLLLFVFRGLVQKNSDDLAVSSQEGILGLLEQGRVYMLQPGQTDERQHVMVKDTLRDLMTPLLPPVYRLFMSGIVPRRVADRLPPSAVAWIQAVGNPHPNEGDLQFGPVPYAPYLTTVITPLFFQFLVGPSHPNARKDGQPGGLVVEKCKFLQESGCKGMCLHICKLPTQQFFRDELGMALTVSPNFETQECQWSFGEEPLPPNEDPNFPRGCLVGCESRSQIQAQTRSRTQRPEAAVV